MIYDIFFTVCEWNFLRYIVCFSNYAPGLSRTLLDNGAFVSVRAPCAVCPDDLNDAFNCFFKRIMKTVSLNSKDTNRQAVSLYVHLPAFMLVFTCLLALPNERTRPPPPPLLCFPATGVWSRPLGDSPITWQEAANAAGPVVNPEKSPPWGHLQAPLNTCLRSS